MSDDSVGNNVGQESKAGEPRRPILRKMTSQAGVREGGAGRVPRGGGGGGQGGRACIGNRLVWVAGGYATDADVTRVCARVL